VARRSSRCGRGRLRRRSWRGAARLRTGLDLHVHARGIAGTRRGKAGYPHDQLVRAWANGAGVPDALEADEVELRPQQCYRGRAGAATRSVPQQVGGVGPGYRDLARHRPEPDLDVTLVQARAFGTAAVRRIATNSDSTSQSVAWRRASNNHDDIAVAIVLGHRCGLRGEQEKGNCGGGEQDDYSNASNS
jgi:hypothetical protein